MKITKYIKKNQGLYTIFIDNEKTYDIYEEVILKSELLLKKSIDQKELELLLKENQKWACYYQALKLLRKKAKTKKEMIKYLMTNNYHEKEIEYAIKKLEQQKYLDDKSYARSYVHNRIMTTNKGPKKIILELDQKGLTAADYKEALEEYSEDIELEKINKIITKKMASNHNKSPKILKQKIEQALIIEGFHKELIKTSLNNFEFTSNKDIAKKEYQKYYQKLSKKYQGSELDYKVKQKMYTLGFGDYFNEE